MRLDTMDITGAVITADALHTQRGTADYIAARGAHYIPPRQGQPTQSPHAAESPSMETGPGPGRRPRAPPWPHRHLVTEDHRDRTGSGFPHAVHVLQLTRKTLPPPRREVAHRNCPRRDLPVRHRPMTCRALPGSRCTVTSMSRSGERCTRCRRSGLGQSLDPRADGGLVKLFHAGALVKAPSPSATGGAHRSGRPTRRAGRVCDARPHRF